MSEQTDPLAQLILDHRERHPLTYGEALQHRGAAGRGGPHLQLAVDDIDEFVQFVLGRHHVARATLGVNRTSRNLAE